MTFEKIRRESTSVKVDPRLWERFRKETVNRDTSMSEVLEGFVRQWLDEPPVQEVPPHLKKFVEFLRVAFTTEEKVRELQRFLVDGQRLFGRRD